MTLAHIKMIESILELLQDADGETEIIQLASGKYKLPETMNETFQQFKQELRWAKRLQ